MGDQSDNKRTYLTVDLDKLKAGEGENYEYPHGKKEDEARIRGLIRENVSFAGVVYGYRGTGKTSFVNHVLEEFKDRVIIRFNATNYDDYPKFLKRFIRELYFAVNKANEDREAQEDTDKFETLRNIYRHTFYNITESSKEENIKSETLTRNLSLGFEAVTEKTIDIVSVFSLVLAGLAVFLFKDSKVVDADSLKQFIIAGMSIVGLDVVLKLIFKADIEKNSTKEHDDTKTKYEESLYDDEIAEYYVFKEIEEISSEAGFGKIIFVLDELDKLDGDKIKKIIKDLKPLILSDYVISILVAGKNYENYLEEEQDETDSIAGNIFSQKIYIPLADREKAIRIMTSFLKNGDSSLSGERNSLPEEITEYLDEKIVRAEGVIRNMINLILSDITWEKKDDNGDETKALEPALKVPFVMLREKDDSYTISNSIKQSSQKISKLDDYINTYFEDKLSAKTDEMFKLAFRISRYVCDKDIDFDEAGKLITKEALKEYISANTSHLSSKEVNLVFSYMFENEKDEDEDTEAFGVEENVSDSVSEVADKVRDGVFYSVNMIENGIKVSNKEIDRINKMLQDVNRLFALFANGDQVEKDKIRTVFTELELDNCDYFSYEEHLQGRELISDEEFKSILASKMVILERIDNPDIDANMISFEGIPYLTVHVAESLLRIWYWRKYKNGCSYHQFSDRKSNTYMRRWDIADLSDGCLTLVLVKYYKRNYTNEGTIKNIFAEAKKMLKMPGVETVNVVFAVFVPDSDRLVDSFGINKGIALGLVGSEPDNIKERIRYSICYFSYNRRRDFYEELMKFDDIISNPPKKQLSDRDKFLNALSGMANSRMDDENEV